MPARSGPRKQGRVGGEGKRNDSAQLPLPNAREIWRESGARYCF